jgi:hypothetical protein
MSEFQATQLDIGSLEIHNNTTTEPIVIKERAFEATTSIGKVQFIAAK